MNHTPSQTIGPFFSIGLGWMADDNPPATDSPPPVELTGTVLDGDGGPVPDAMLEFWQAPLFGRVATAGDGTFRFSGLRRGPGPGAAQVDVSVFARGLMQRLVTRVYLPGGAASYASDPFLERVPPERRDTLMARTEADRLVFDIHLQGPRETVFFAY